MTSRFTRCSPLSELLMVVFHSKTQVKPKFLVLSASELLLGSYHAFFNVTAKRLSFIFFAFLYLQRCSPPYCSFYNVPLSVFAFTIYFLEIFILVRCKYINMKSRYFYQTSSKANLQRHFFEKLCSFISKPTFCEQFNSMR